MSMEFSKGPEQEKNTEKMPPWVYKVKIRYEKHIDDIKVADKELGISYSRERGDEGRINKEIADQVRRKFYEFLKSMEGKLPEVIPSGKQTEPMRSVRLNTNLGSIVLGGGMPFSEYFVPKSNEIYRIQGTYEHINEAGHPQNKPKFPESPDFLGIDAIKNEKFDTGTNVSPYLPIFFDQVGPTGVHGELTISEMENIIENLSSTIGENDKPILDTLKDDIQKIKIEGEKIYAEQQKKCAKMIRESLFDLVDVIEENCPDQKIPEKIKGILMPYGWLFLLTKERKIVSVQHKRKKNWLGKTVDEFDFGSAKEVTDKDMQAIHSISSDLLNIFPLKIRSFIGKRD